MLKRQRGRRKRYAPFSPTPSGPLLHNTFRYYHMLIRIVRMTFRPDTIDAFFRIFEQAAPAIRNFPGCLHLELWQDHDADHVLTSFSHWTSDNALTCYRTSTLFQETWSKVTPLFDAQPVARSHKAMLTIQKDTSRPA